jgi:hypothetical protein
VRRRSKSEIVALLTEYIVYENHILKEFLQLT